MQAGEPPRQFLQRHFHRINNTNDRQIRVNEKWTLYCDYVKSFYYKGWSMEQLGKIWDETELYFESHQQ